MEFRVCQHGKQRPAQPSWPALHSSPLLRPLPPHHLTSHPWVLVKSSTQHVAPHTCSQELHSACQANPLVCQPLAQFIPEGLDPRAPAEAPRWTFCMKHLESFYYSFWGLCTHHLLPCVHTCLPLRVWAPWEWAPGQTHLCSPSACSPRRHAADGRHRFAELS